MKVIKNRKKIHQIVIMVLAPKVHSEYRLVKARTLFSYVLGTKNILCRQNSHEQIRRTQSGTEFLHLLSRTSRTKMAKNYLKDKLYIKEFTIFSSLLILEKLYIYYCCEELWNIIYIFTLLDWSLLNNSLVVVIFFFLILCIFFHPNKS